MIFPKGLQLQPKAMRPDGKGAVAETGKMIQSDRIH